MELLRTPDDRFEGLPGFDFAPRYVEVPTGDGNQRLRVHHLDEGPADGPVVLLQHGEPTWCYLYRKMIPILAGAGLRCIAPDLVGFGRSDKPADRRDLSYRRMVDWLAATVFDQLDLNGVTLVGQDWGALLGLRLVGEHPDRFAGVVLSNGGLPTGDHKVAEAFRAWQTFTQTAESFPIGRIVAGGCTGGLTPEEEAAYDAPFPDDTYKEAARQLPSLVPTTPDDPAAADNRAAWAVLQDFDKPFLTAFTDSDPVTAGGDKPFRKLVPGAADQPHTTIEGAGHFVQEDAAPELARIVIDHIERYP